MQEESASIDVYTMLTIMVEQMASVAWVKMGLQSDPISGKTEKDIAQARLAIDIAHDLAKRLESQLDEPDKRQIDNLLRDLKINFVTQSGEQS